MLIWGSIKTFPKQDSNLVFPNKHQSAMRHIVCTIHQAIRNLYYIYLTTLALTQNYTQQNNWRSIDCSEKHGRVAPFISIIKQSEISIRLLTEHLCHLLPHNTTLPEKPSPNRALIRPLNALRHIKHLSNISTACIVHKTCFTLRTPLFFTFVNTLTNKFWMKWHWNPV